MVATRLIVLHNGKGKTAAKTLQEHLDYNINIPVIRRKVQWYGRPAGSEMDQLVGCFSYQALIYL